MLQLKKDAKKEMTLECVLNMWSGGSMTKVVRPAKHFPIVDVEAIETISSLTQSVRWSVKVIIWGNKIH